MISKAGLCPGVRQFWMILLRDTLVLETLCCADLFVPGSGGAAGCETAKHVRLAFWKRSSYILSFLFQPWHRIVDGSWGSRRGPVPAWSSLRQG